MLKRILLILLFMISFSPKASAFWVWTPDTNQWVNPKYSIKDTPQKQLDYAFEIFNSGEYEKAIREYNKLLKHYPKSKEAPDAQFYIAECHLRQGELLKAFKNYQTVIDKYPFNERAAEVVKRQFEVGNLYLEGRAKHNKIIKTITGGDYDVIEVFRAVIRNAPYGEYAAQSQYKIGLYLQDKGMLQEARDEFEKTMNDYPSTKWAEAAKYQIAMSDSKRSAGAQYNQSVTKTAIEEFKDFVAENPDAELSQQAHAQIRDLREKEAENIFVIAEFYEKQKQYQAARIYYSSIVEQYQNTSWVAKSLEKIQELNLKK